jgi:hypothetical protein
MHHINEHTRSFATMTAAPITSAGRFSLWGPRGIIPSPL